MTRAAKHLQVRQVMVVFAEVYVMRVAWRIALADFTAMGGTLPSLLLPTLRPSPRIWQGGAAMLPRRTCLPVTSATQSPSLILRHLLTTQAGCLSTLRRPPRLNASSYLWARARRLPSRSQNACRAGAH